MKIDRRGFTLFEMLVTGVLAGIVIAVVARYLPQIPRAFRHIQVQQLMHSQSTTAMDTMVRLLRVGKASTVQLCSCNQGLCSAAACNPPTVVVPSNSQIDFFTLDGHSRCFYWGSDNTLMMEDYVAPNASPTTVVLASNVTNISFNLPVAPDFSIVTINLTMNAPVDSAGETKTLILPTQSVRMITNQ